MLAQQRRLYLGFPQARQYIASWRNDLTISFRNLLRQRRRSAIAILSVVGGVVALLLASGFIQWIFEDLRESSIRAQLGHLQIVKPGYHETGRSDPFRFLLPPDTSLLSRISNEPGVRVVAPRLAFSGLVSRGETTLSVLGEGVSPAAEAELSRAITLVTGDLLHEGDEEGVLFGEGLARNLGVSIGDAVTILATSASGGMNGLDLKVRGVFRTVTKAYDDHTVRVPIQAVRKLLRVDGAHVWVLLLERTDQTDTVAASLRDHLDSNEIQVVPWFDLADFYNKTVALFSKQVAMLQVIISAIIILCITNTMMMVVLERTGEIGTSLALGVRRSRIFGCLVIEGAMFGLAGGILGVAIGYLAARLVSHIGIPMPPPPGMAHGFIGQIFVTPRLAFESMALAVVTTVGASVYPAFRASRVEIVNALRYNR